MTRSPTGQMSPGAVPRVWGITVAPAGTVAWRRLLADIVRPRAAKSSRITASSSARRSRPTPITSAMDSRVMSSWVGPRPPQQITASLRESAWRRAATIRP